MAYTLNLKLLFIYDISLKMISDWLLKNGIKVFVFSPTLPQTPGQDRQVWQAQCFFKSEYNTASVPNSYPAIY